MDTKTFIKTYLTNNISKIASLVILSLSTILLKISIPILIKYFIDFALKGPVSDYGKMVIIFTISLGFVTSSLFLIDQVRQNKMTSFGNDITVELRTATYQSLMKSELYETNKYDHDELCNTIVNSTRILGDDYFSGKLIKLLYNALELGAAIITLLVLDATYAFLVALSLPVYYFIYKYLKVLAEKREEVFLERIHNHQDTIHDDIKGMKVIKTRNGVEKQIDLYEKTLVNNKRVIAKNINVKYTANKFLPAVFSGGMIFVLFLRYCYAIWDQNDMDWIYRKVGVIIGCALLVPTVVFVFREMLELYYLTIDTEAEVAKIDNILNLRAERRSENVPSLEEIHSLKFNNVAFDYSIYGAKHMVNLEKIDFEVKKGERLGIIGLPGSGKTTIADLITKLIRPRQGNVLINNCDINKLNTNYLRSIVTYVPEDYKLLNASIETNVTYPFDLDEYKYNDALNKCKLKDLIFTLPQRDETNAKEVTLSKSDIQKISLANAFYKDSPIMVLDDATSKLDSTTEDEIMTEFYKLKNKISIVITSRIHNVIKCDKILILSNGKIVEYGNVDELLAKKDSTFAVMAAEAGLDKKVV